MSPEKGVRLLDREVPDGRPAARAASASSSTGMLVVIVEAEQLPVAAVCRICCRGCDPCDGRSDGQVVTREFPSATTADPRKQFQGLLAIAGIARLPVTECGGYDPVGMGASCVIHDRSRQPATDLRIDPGSLSRAMWAMLPRRTLFTSPVIGCSVALPRVTSPSPNQSASG